MKTLMQVRRVVIDSSAIIACLEDKRDLLDALRESFEGYVEVVVPGVVVEELKTLAARGGRRGLAARIALSLLEKCSGDVTFRVVNVSARNADEALLELAAMLNAYLITLDRKLRKAAQARGIIALTYVRSKKRFG